MVQPLLLDLRRSAGIRRRLAGWCLLAFGLLSLCISAGLWAHTHRAVAAATAEYEALKGSALRSNAVQAALDASAVAKVRSRVANAEPWLARPWGELIATVEALRPTQGSISLLEADAETGLFSLTAAVARLGDGLELATRMEQRRGVSEVELISHAEAAQATLASGQVSGQPTATVGSKEVRLSVRARWSQPINGSTPVPAPPLPRAGAEPRGSVTGGLAR